LTVDSSTSTPKLQSSFLSEPNVLKKEVFSNGVLKTTFSSGISMLKIPKTLMLNSNMNLTPNCGTPPSNATGCCCLSFVSYTTLNVPGLPNASGFLFEDEKIYTFTDGSVHFFHLKVSSTSEFKFNESVLLDVYLNNEPPSLASCTDSYNVLIMFEGNLSQCEGPILVEAKKVYQLVGSSTINTCVATSGNSYYYPLITPPFNCSFQ
jgi:hypothetical protein